MVAPMPLDLASELLAALRSPDGRSALAEAVEPVVERVVRRLLDENDQDQLLDTNALSRVLGISPRALRMRLTRGSQLAEIALSIDGRRVWRRRDVQALMARSSARVPAGGASR